MNQPLDQFIAELSDSLRTNRFVKVTLSKPLVKPADLQNIYVKKIQLKAGERLSFTLRYQDKDQVKNFPIEEGVEEIRQLMGDSFGNAHLFTITGDHALQFNKKRKAKFFSQKPTHTSLPDLQHDHQKTRLIQPDETPYLVDLGVFHKNGQPTKSGAKKYRQINKYLEIIDNLLTQVSFPKKPNIIDIGSGKGYLTFALYDYLTSRKQFSPEITGYELRPHLVELCNNISQQYDFNGLNFQAKDINQLKLESIDMLIALHACDTLTDVAIALGIQADADVIVVAPCCHKQIRNEMKKPNTWQAILDYGILLERQSEIITDGIRALLLEHAGYETKVFEFVGFEHTGKNIMITATKKKPSPDALGKVRAIKSQFGIEQHYLENLLKL